MDRKQHEQAWASGTADVMCATKSFGIGIDKKDVRFVLHFTFPDSVENYVQEIGRAGRDGLPAHCVLLFAYGDRGFHLHNIMQIQDDEHKTYKYESINTMVKYCSQSSCRHQFILSYFNENSPVCEEHCDCCTSSHEHTTKDCTDESCGVVSSLQKLQLVIEKVNVLTLVQFIMGS